jgi:DNA-binding cell septation regulator SpoVG
MEFKILSIQKPTFESYNSSLKYLVDIQFGEEIVSRDWRVVQWKGETFIAAPQVPVPDSDGKKHRRTLVNLSPRLRESVEAEIFKAVKIMEVNKNGRRNHPI